MIGCPLVRYICGSYRISTGRCGEKVTYGNGGGVATGKDGEKANPSDIIVEQQDTGLVGFDGPLKIGISGTTWDQFLTDARSECPNSDVMSTQGEENAPVKDVSSSGLSNNSEDLVSW